MGQFFDKFTISTFGCMILSHTGCIQNDHTFQEEESISKIADADKIWNIFLLYRCRPNLMKMNRFLYIFVDSIVQSTFLLFKWTTLEYILNSRIVQIFFAYTFIARWTWAQIQLLNPILYFECVKFTDAWIAIASKSVYSKYPYCAKNEYDKKKVKWFYYCIRSEWVVYDDAHFRIPHSYTRPYTSRSL